ncbi:MAG: hypothetical protein O7G30_15435, partial [Proteobacteria bacterium]|nr:hypothetical protein [Pseudomonadota bacterium]
SWILRRSRPEVGFESVEVTLPWLASSVAGVNVRGLAAALAVGVGPDDAGSTAPLLVQECLQRFEHLDAALDWCLKRPVSGTGCVILSDASGESAAVEIGAVYRRVRRPAEGILVAGDGSERAAQVRKALGLGRDLEAALGLCVSLDPAARSLALLRDGSARVDVCA